MKTLEMSRPAAPTTLTRVESVVKRVLVLALLSSTLSCNAYLEDLRRENCTFRLNGVCNEPEICEVGGDIADCHTGPYGACHDLLTGLFHGDRCTARGDSLCVPGSLPADTSICTRSCTRKEQCPEVKGFKVACEPIKLLGVPDLFNACAIKCKDDFVCPAGMLCVEDNRCVWANYTLEDEVEAYSLDHSEGTAEAGQSLP